LAHPGSHPEFVLERKARPIRNHRPTPGAVIALAALVVALGGVAFAAIPDSGGTVHTCYQKANGSLRVVESESDCRASENPLALSAAGQSVGGSHIVARVRSTGPTPVNANSVQIPLTNNTWTQNVTETNELFIETRVSIPPADGCATSRVFFSVDGQEITGFQYGGGGNFGVTNRLQTFLLDPGATTSHTVTARVETAGAGTTCGAVIESVRINVDATT
jgi:hypothetical protein